jgi:hypothetical protein
MYTIGHVIYGAPITKEIEEVAEQRDEEVSEYDGGYFETFYHGGASKEQGYIGIELKEFDECEDLLFSELDIEPTDEQRQEVVDKIGTLPEEYRKVLKPIDRYIVWSSS